MQYANCNFRYVYFDHIFHESRKQSRFTQSKPSWGNNNVEENITHKIILSLSWRNFTTWQSTSKIEPPIGMCSRKQNFPCDDQVRINNIVIESKTSWLNLKRKMLNRSWGTILCVITNPQGMCSKIKFTGDELKFLSLFSNISFHNAINIITLSVSVTSA